MRAASSRASRQAVRAGSGARVPLAGQVGITFAKGRVTAASTASITAGAEATGIGVGQEAFGLPGVVWTYGNFYIDSSQLKWHSSHISHAKVTGNIGKADLHEEPRGSVELVRP